MLQRRAQPVGVVPPSPIPEFPEVPPDVLERFPSLVKWQGEVKLWVERANGALSNLNIK